MSIQAKGHLTFYLYYIFTISPAISYFWKYKCLFDKVIR